MSLIAMRNRPPVSVRGRGIRVNRRRHRAPYPPTSEDHVDVLFLGRARQRVAPEQVKPLPAVQREELL